MSILSVEHLNKRFGETRAVDDVTLLVERGQFLSLVGANGAGKTSLCNVVTAHLPQDSGRIFFEGKDISQTSVNERIRMGIARSFQLVNLFDELTAMENVALSVFSRDNKCARMASLAYRDNLVWREAYEVLRQFGLAEQKNVIAGQLSQGERKLLDVAVAFALRPRLLFLDEPTSGVGTRDKSQIMQMVAETVRGEGITIVIVEHDMEVVYRYSDRIIAMHQGRVLADGTPDEIKGNPEVCTVLLGRESFPGGN